MRVIRRTVDGEMFPRGTPTCSLGTRGGAALEVPAGDRFAWDRDSTYIRQGDVFRRHAGRASARREIRGARVPRLLGGRVDDRSHLARGGDQDPESSAGGYLDRSSASRGILQLDGARRGNHEVMVRGTFASVRPKNRLAPAARAPLRPTAPTARISDLRRRDPLPGRRRAADRARRRVRLGLLARLGRAGAALLGVRAAIVELRADPALEPPPRPRGSSRCLSSRPPGEEPEPLGCTARMQAVRRRRRRERRGRPRRRCGPTTRVRRPRAPRTRRASAST